MHFIKIGNRIVNPEHIISVEYDPKYKDYHSRDGILLKIETAAVTGGDHGTESREYWYRDEEATMLWEKLCDYLSPVELMAYDECVAQIERMQPQPAPVDTNEPPF